MNEKEIKSVEDFINEPINLTPTPGVFPVKPCEHQRLKWADGEQLKQRCEDCGLIF